MDMDLSSIALPFGILAFTVVVVLMQLFKYFNAKPVCIKTASLMVIAGSGGHTAEILRLVSALPDDRYFPRVYVVAESDLTSSNKIKDFEENRSEKCLSDSSYSIVRIPRSREVLQSWLTTMLTTAYSILFSIPLIFKWKPDLILSNGPGTCVPICCVALLFRYVRLVNTRVVYVESICRVYDLSLSAKILYRFVDRIIVQWPELHDKYPRALYLGRLS